MDHSEDDTPATPDRILSIIGSEHPPAEHTVSYWFSFEENFDVYWSHKWIAEGWWHRIFYISAVYLICIYVGTNIMRSRPPFHLRKPLVLWNTFFAIFSFIGACRTVPELLHVLGHHGLTHSVCVPSFIFENKVTACWSHLFVVSKIWELGDTTFVVLRKRRLPFLHWYHHCTTLIFSWFSYMELSAVARWYTTMNLYVHFLMYTYYAFRAMRVKPPRWTAMFITVNQIAQMIIGMFVTSWTLVTVLSGTPCNTTAHGALFGLLMYAPHFAMFLNLFYSRYIRPSAACSDEGHGD